MKPVILLTATVDPRGMSETSLTDPEVRKNQYMEAISYYLDRTDLKIVVCENTKCDFFNEILNPQKDERLEFLTFNGNDYDTVLGKGLGEAFIIEHALKNSKFIDRETVVIKITGRIKILNIHSLINTVKKSKKEISTIWCELSNSHWIKTTCFAVDSAWLFESALNHITLIQQLNHNISIEETFCKRIVSSEALKIKKFYPIIEGINGCKNKPYNNPEKLTRNLNHCNSLFFIYKWRGDRLKSVINLFLWLFFLTIWKSKRLLTSPIPHDDRQFHA